MKPSKSFAVTCELKSKLFPRAPKTCLRGHCLPSNLIYLSLALGLRTSPHGLSFLFWKLAKFTVISEPLHVLFLPSRTLPSLSQGWIFPIIQVLTQVTSSDSPGPFRTPLPHLESLCPEGVKPPGAPTQMSSDLPWLLEKVDSIGKAPSCQPPAPCTHTGTTVEENLKVW